MKKGLLAVLVLLLPVIPCVQQVVADKADKSIEVSTDKTTYEIEEEVTIILKNISSSPLEGTPSCVIYDSSGKEVFSPAVAQVITNLEPNESLQFTWNQTDNEGKQVKDEDYRVECSFAGLTDKAEFKIKSSYVNIGSIIEKPDKYEGKEVRVKGRFMGWSSKVNITTPSVTRSDWIVEDDTGAIYVTGLCSKPLKLWGWSDYGKKIIVTGIVGTKDGGPYLQGIGLTVVADINVKVNETFTIELEQALIPYYEWKSIEYNESYVELIDEGFKAPDSGLVGVTIKYFIFKAVNEGLTELKFAYGEIDVNGNLVEISREKSYIVNIKKDISPADKASLVEGNSAFAFELYQELRGEQGNLFYSPYSISAALAMTYAGARCETEQQIADTLHFILKQERLHPAFNWLDAELAKRGEGAEGKDGKGFRLNIANAIWGQEGYEFLPKFLDVLAENYGAGVRFMDFVNEAEKSRLAINQWVSDQTEGRIEDLIPPDAIDQLTRLVLTNAIYFNAAWAIPFDEKMTADRPFYLLDGGQVTVPMMEKRGSFFGYAKREGFQAVELPYDGGELSMIILLPALGNFDAFEAELDAQQVSNIISGLQPTQVDLTMPKFEFDSKFSLKDTLAWMGMPIAFTLDADFSGMAGNPDLLISDVIHKAFVSVDEAGTEAAAATAVVIELTGVIQSVEVSLDRPFIFLIRDIETGAILFVGRVLNPAA